MEIRRSEVWIPTWSGYALGIIRSQAKRKGKEYFASGPHGNCTVYEVKGAGVCTVSQLIDDRPSPEEPELVLTSHGIERRPVQWSPEGEKEDPFPPLPEEPNADTAQDRARDAALRETR